jgi:hypothetical protein
MRFSSLLPLLQTIAILLILWAPWTPHAHEIDVILRDGAKVKAWSLIPGPVAVEWAEAINLPAAAIVTPVEFALRKSDGLLNYKVRFYGLWIVGLLCWYMVGRFLDDLLRWRRTGALPTKHPGDLAFALLVVPSTILLGSVFVFDGADSRVLAVWSILWLAVAALTLAFRLLQVIRQRRRRLASSD